MKKGVSKVDHELNQLNKHFDGFLSSDPVFTERDKRMIRERIKQQRYDRKSFSSLIPQLLTVALFVIGLFYIGNYAMNELNMSQSDSEAVQPESPKSIDGAVESEEVRGEEQEQEQEETLDTETRRTFDSMELSKKLQITYEAFVTTKDDELLRGLLPHEVFKLYFYADEKEDYETQYALYLQDEEDTIILYETVEEYISELKEASEEELSSTRRLIYEQLAINKTFEEVIVNNKNATITISEELALGFSLSKNDNGIWKVNWLPMQ